MGWSFADPSTFKGIQEETLEQTRKVRDEIKQTILSFIEEAKDGNFWLS
ncbi:MAG: arsC1 [Mucilaginibacter sp.]|jgi:arsenate reductase|nr:arsC1 [Mucilaginibacter sp.]